MDNRFGCFAVVALTLLTPRFSAAQPAPEEPPPAEAPPPLIEVPTGAQVPPLPPPPPPAPAPQPESANCHDVNCKLFTTPDDVKVFEYYAYLAGLTCKQTIEKLHSIAGADDKDEKEVRRFYFDEKRDSPCDDPPKLVRGALDVAVWATKGRRGLWDQEQGLQILPSFALGVPLGQDDSTNAGKALKGLTALSGLVVRYSPISFWASVHGVFGLAQPDASRLDNKAFPNPQLVVFGGGVDALGGVLSITYLLAQLRPDGMFSKTNGHTGFLNVSIDLTTLGVTVAGLAK